MNSFFFVVLLCAVAFAAVDVELQFGKVTVIEIPKGKTTLSFKCKPPSGSQVGIIRVAACFGDLSLFNDTNEIDPKAAKNPLVTFTPQLFAKSFGYGGDGTVYGLVKANAVTSDFYDDATGVFEAYCTNDPQFSSKIPQEKTKISKSINLNEHWAKLTFTLNNDKDYDYQVYTGSFPKSGFNPKNDLPPKHFFNSACSSALWLDRDPEAEKITFTSSTGTVKVTGISKPNVTVATVVYGVNAESPHVYLTSIALNGSGMVAPILFLTLLVLFITIFF